MGNSKQVGIWIKELDKKEGIMTVMEAKPLVKQRGKKRRKCCSFGMVMVHVANINKEAGKSIELLMIYN
jgi:hypothetical protein